MPTKRIPWAKYFFQFALPAFLLSTKAAAQGKVRVLTGDTVVVPEIPHVEVVKAMTGVEQKRERMIGGRVIDENGKGIPYATIFIKATTIGVAADSTGSFSLKYSGHENRIVLVGSCIGFKEVETIVDLNEMEKSITTSLPSKNVLPEIIVVASTVLNSETAIRVNIQIIRVFTKMRELLSTHKDILLHPDSYREEKMEKKLTGHDEDLALVFKYLK